MESDLYALWLLRGSRLKVSVGLPANGLFLSTSALPCPGIVSNYIARHSRALIQRRVILLHGVLDGYFRSGSYRAWMVELVMMLSACNILYTCICVAYSSICKHIVSNFVGIDFVKRRQD